MRTINKENILARTGRVVVLYGGDSSEREISLISGSEVFKGLQRLGIDATLIDVGKDIVEKLQNSKPDLVFNMLHGKGGEDGAMQGLLEMMGLPYTGSGVLASALAMDKVKTKLIWQRLGLNTAHFVELTTDTDWDVVIEEMGKVVVKPVSGGSSLGISICESAEQLESQFKHACEYDFQVMAEQYIAGAEFSTGVIGSQLLPTIQLETDRQFFDFDAKYIDEGTRITCPAKISKAELVELENLVRDAYGALSCSGLARVDVMQGQQGDFFLLELNTIPGMTSHSFVPLSAKEIDIDFDELLLRILDEELSVQ